MRLRYLHHPAGRRALRRLNPRQAKKLRVGEHRIAIVRIEVLPREATGAAFDAALRALVDCVEARGMHTAAGGRPEERLIDASCALDRGSLDVGAALALLSALRACPEIERVEPVEMADGWWGHRLEQETAALLHAAGDPGADSPATPVGNASGDR